MLGSLGWRDEIGGLINERRRYKNQNSTQKQQYYKRIPNEVQRKIKRPKEEWLDEQCKKAEYLKRDRSDLAFLEINKLFRERKYNSGTLISKNGEIILEADLKAKRWKEYLEDLYEDNLYIKYLKRLII